MTEDLEEQYDKIYKYCYMKTHHQQTAEDITQETFLRFLEDYEYKEMGKKLAYLYTIARNKCIDDYRKKQTVPLTEEIPEESREEKVITSIVVRNAVAKLGKEEQELIFLRYVNDISTRDIGRIMGISRFAVYRKLRHCLNRLKKELGEEGFE